MLLQQQAIILDGGHGWGYLRATSKVHSGSAHSAEGAGENRGRVGDTRDLPLIPHGERGSEDNGGTAGVLQGRGRHRPVGSG